MPSLLRTSISGLMVATAISLVSDGCGLPARVPPTPYIPPQPVIVQPPHEIGPGKVTTASFYGPKFQGHATSNGEIYNPHDLTAASRTLPIGSHAKVTDLKTGKSVVVRINDHGPYVKGRGIDLSRAAADKIGIDHRGIAKVKVTRVDGHPADAVTSTRKHPRDHSNVTPVDYPSGSGSSPASEAR